MTPEQMARLADGNFEVHDYVDINYGGNLPNGHDADYRTYETPYYTIRELATMLTTLQQEKAALLHHEALIEARTQRGITDCSTPLFVRVENIVAQLEKAERERDALEEVTRIDKRTIEGLRATCQYGVQLLEQAEATTRRLEEEFRERMDKALVVNEGRLDEITSLKETTRRLEAELATHCGCQFLDGIGEVPCESHAAVETENRRLREALESIANNSCCEGCQEAARWAKSALAGKEE